MPKVASREPLSVAKMDINQLRNYTAQVQSFTEGSGAVAIRICECCIKISISATDDRS